MQSRLPPAGGELPRDRSTGRGSLGDRMQRAHTRMLSRNVPSIGSETRGLQVFAPSLATPHPLPRPAPVCPGLQLKSWSEANVAISSSPRPV